jgi:hypothetical protein
MATAFDLAEFLGPIVGLHVSTVERHARHLREAGFLPDEGEPLTAAHTALVLAVVTGSRAPTEAVEAARAFRDGLPLVAAEAVAFEGETGAFSGKRVGPNALPRPLPEDELAWSKLEGGFLGALEILIEQAGQPVAKAASFPTSVALLRDLDAPAALMSFTDEVRGTLYFGSVGIGSTSEKLEIWASFPVLLIPMVGDLIAGPASWRQAGMNPGAVAQAAR